MKHCGMIPNIPVIALLSFEISIHLFQSFVLRPWPNIDSHVEDQMPNV